MSTTMTTKCDRCGKTKKVSTGWVQIQVSRPSYATPKVKYDLCPDCISGFSTFMVKE